ncbi:hypothetical protein ACFOMD_07405 [Sphingoaurantiacus capsulatus]|uniref:Uncharacterized protein n=1 Tax=Sphingoaurantiacus capsulatus TaxID=1771310 RepID=A0ABV7X8E6_9SPHN
MTLVSLGGSIAAVLLVSWLVGRLGLGRGAKLDAATARRIAGDTYIGHRFDEVVIDRDNRGALVAGSAGEVVLLRAHGDKWVARLLGLPLPARADGEALIIPAGETMFGPTTLTLGTEAALAWGRKLRGDA